MTQLVVREAPVGAVGSRTRPEFRDRKKAGAGVGGPRGRQALSDWVVLGGGFCRVDVGETHGLKTRVPKDKNKEHPLFDVASFSFGRW